MTARAAIAVAEIGPMLGMVISRRDTSSSRARRAISLSRTAILPLRLASRSSINFGTSMSSAGRPSHHKSGASNVGYWAQKTDIAGAPLRFLIDLNGTRCPPACASICPFEDMPAP
jgi:hypothetical protein